MSDRVRDTETGYDPTAEATGRYIIAFIDAAGEVSPVFAQKVERIFEEKIGDVSAEEYYRHDKVKEGFEAVLVEVGPKTMTEGGIATAKELPFPDDTTIQEALEMLREEHSVGNSYRNTDSDRPAGQYTFDLSGTAGHFGATNGYPYTKPYVKGIYQGIIEKYGPRRARPEFTEATPKPNEKFAWHVEW